MPIIQIPTPMRDAAGGQAELSVHGGTVKAALASLVLAHPALEAKLFDAGKLRPFVNVFVNDEDIRFLDDLETAVAETDVVALIPAVAGG
jgi:molybdopterin converting factor small subunit